jgi:predicted Zn-dependent peptidase
LVRGRGLATETAAAQQAMKWAGCFNISAECGEGRAPAEVEQAIHAELDKLAREAVPAAELQKVKNRLAAAEYRRLTSNMSILFALVFAEGGGDWRELNTAGAKYQAVTAADLRRVATTYFARENRCVASYTRKPATPAENPNRDPQP